MSELILTKTRKLEELAGKIYEFAAQMHALSLEMTLLIAQVEIAGFKMDDELKKITGGFKNDRAQATSKRGKKPFVHCVESKGNKRKLN